MKGKIEKTQLLLLWSYKKPNSTFLVFAWNCPIPKRELSLLLRSLLKVTGIANVSLGLPYWMCIICLIMSQLP